MQRKTETSRHLRLAGFLVGLLVSSATFALTVVVTNPADALTGCSTLGTGTVSGGGCTLRDAITFSNANPQAPGIQNLIQFNIPGSGVQTITLNSPLPAITAAVVIDGYTQPGSSPNTLAVGDNAVLLIWVLGTPDTLHNSAVLTITGGNGSVIQGLVIGCGSGNLDPGFPEGIFMTSCCNRIVGNFLGVDPTGTVPEGGGVVVFSNSNHIGGPTPADRNVICHTSLERDIDIHGDRNAVESNLIGTNASGTVALSGALDGIAIDGSFNVIGGPSARGNVISGHLRDGVGISGTSNSVSGNLIGTDASGIAPLGNRTGVTIYDGSQNAIGSSLNPQIFFFQGNRIAFNGADGIQVGIGGSSLPVGNSILSNSIYANGQVLIPLEPRGIGIDLIDPSSNSGPDGATPNDPCDAESGPNGLQNFPVLTNARILNSNQTEIEGSLNSSPNTAYRIQLFASTACNASGFGEGERFLQDVFVTTDSSCNATFNASVPIAQAPAGQYITATATDPSGNTSEFSACEQVAVLRIRSRIRFVEGPIRVAPGVPVEFGFHIETEPPGQVGDMSGEVIVSNDQGEVCHTDVSTAGDGACTLTFPAPGTHLVRAHYLGNASFEQSDSPPVVVRVRSGGG